MKKKLVKSIKDHCCNSDNFIFFVYSQAMFGSQKILGKEKINLKENIFLIFGLQYRKYKIKLNRFKIYIFLNYLILL